MQKPYVKLTIANVTLIGAILLLSFLVNGGAGPHPEVKKVWVEGATSFNLSAQLLVAMSVIIGLSFAGLLATAIFKLGYAHDDATHAYANYTSALLFIGLVASVLVLICPTVPGAAERISIFSLIGVLACLSGVLDMLIMIREASK